MREAGFEDVQTMMYYWPHGEWLANKGQEEYRNIGIFLTTEQPRLYQVILPNMVSGMRFSDKKVRRWQADVLETLKAEEGKHKKYWVTLGKKPD